MYSLLHISDLHRSPDEPITNNSLLAAILADRDNYVAETPEVRSPDAIVVTGDLISGVPKGMIDWQSEIAKQYDIAYEFLAKLVEECVEDQRSRLVVVPGNHDVCWNTSLEAMRMVDLEDEPDEHIPDIIGPCNQYRWSWQNKHLYRITDPSRYNQRLDAYWNFIERFYRDADLRIPIDRSRGFNLFELDEGRIVVAAFESIYGNDCFSDQGNISDDIVPKCGLELRHGNVTDVLRIAVWHHGVTGPPNQSDYMDIKVIHEMIGNGFRLGLHGHQHYSEALAHYIHLPQKHSMAVVSAGSLCAGSRDLPRGVNRQYNVIVIGDDYQSARVHLREMASGKQFGSSRRPGFHVDGTVRLGWTAPTDQLGRTINPRRARRQSIVHVAERAVHRGHPADALNLLSDLDRPLGSYEHLLYLNAAERAKRWDLVVKFGSDPSNADELVTYLEGLMRTGNISCAQEVLAREASRLDLAPLIEKQLKDRISAENLMKALS